MRRKNKADEVEKYLNEHAKPSLREVSKAVNVSLSYVSKIRKRRQDEAESNGPPEPSQLQQNLIRALAIPPPPPGPNGLTIDEAIEKLRLFACTSPLGGDTPVHLDLPGKGRVPLGSITMTGSPGCTVLLSPR